MTTIIADDPEVTVARNIEFIFAHEDTTWRTEIIEVPCPAYLCGTEEELEWLTNWAHENSIGGHDDVYIGVFAFDVVPREEQ